MKPKLAAAIITGTMASPSSPSVRLTALPAPTTTNAPNGTKNQPRLTSRSLKKGKVIDVESGVRRRPSQDDRQAIAGDHRFDRQPRPARKPLSVCLVTLR